MAKLKKTFIAKSKRYFLNYAEQRRHIIKVSGDALHISKRAIFALHRGDITEAEQKIKEASSLINAILKKYRTNAKLLQEGSLKSALEEYVEAELLSQFVQNRSIGDIQGISVEEDSYIAGLCDIPGELYRYAIQAATDGDSKTVLQCQEMADAIVGSLIEFNLTKYLRTKFDQAKGAARKIELVVYEMSIRS